MSISLKKGQGVSLKKNEYDLSSVTIGLGWDINEEKRGFLGGLFGKKSEEYDLDVIAFLCGENGKVNDLGKIEGGHPSLVNGDIIFFNNLQHKSGQIWLTGDNRTGAGDGDDEQIYTLSLHDALPIYAQNIEMARFDLSGGEAFNNQRSMLFAELIREENGWKLIAIGEPSSSDSFISYLKDFT